MCCRRCCRAQTLSNRDHALHLGSVAGVPGVVDICTGLTRLELSSCCVVAPGGDSALISLSELVHLQHLSLESVYKQRADGGGRVHATFPGHILPCLQSLTHLRVLETGCDAGMHHVSFLSKLSVLDIACNQGPDAQLPLRLAPDIAPGAEPFALPASLHELFVGEGVLLDASLLSSATQLKELHLIEAGVEDGPDQSDGSALLAAVANLQELETLHLERMFDVEWPAPCAAYGAFTASSKLTSLAVQGFGLPVVAWEHVFPPTRHLPALAHFSPCKDGDDPGCWGYSYS